MICDAHVHVGYFPRKGYEEPYYYSPRRVLGILNRAGVEEFIFSSTNAIWDFKGDAMHAEAREMLRLAPGRAHPFFWITDEYLKRDRDLERVPDFYEGFKLHGGETPWLHHKKLLKRVLSIARERRFPVQIHTGGGKDERDNPLDAYLYLCMAFKDVKFDLAHGKPFQTVPDAVNNNENVYVDCAYCTPEIVQGWLNAGAREERILFGSDIPVQQKLTKVSLTGYLKKTLRGISSPQILSQNFKDFLAK